jgi:hypothetical protein
MDEPDLVVALDHDQNTCKRDFKVQSKQWQRFDRSRLPKEYLAGGEQ